MNNADMPAMPCSQTIDRDNDKTIPHQFGNNDFVVPGLTKREHFAAMALQGILSASEGRVTADHSCKAVKVADALLNELEQNQ